MAHAHALTQTHLTFRPMSEADIPAVEKLARKIWEKDYTGYIITAEQTEYMLKLMYSQASLQEQVEKNHRFTLVEEGGTLLGYASVEETAPGQLFLHKLYVASSSQRTGLGAALLDKIIAHYSPRALSLHVNTHNWRALNFYFRSGFSITGTGLTDIGGGFVMDDFIMSRDVV